LVTLLLLSIVITVVKAPVGLIEPVEVTWIAPAELVASGVVVAVLMVVSAQAVEAEKRARVTREVDDRSRRIVTIIPLSGSAPPLPVCWRASLRPARRVPRRKEDNRNWEERGTADAGPLSLRNEAGLEWMEPEARMNGC
jgi:hypothetical protein